MGTQQSLMATPSAFPPSKPGMALQTDLAESASSRAGDNAESGEPRTPCPPILGHLHHHRIAAFLSDLGLSFSVTQATGAHPNPDRDDD